MGKKIEAGEKGMKKSEAFRLAVEALGIEAPIGDIVDHMKEKFNVEIDKNMASTYRSNFKRSWASAARCVNLPPNRARTPTMLSIS